MREAVDSSAMSTLACTCSRARSSSDCVTPSVRKRSSSSRMSASARCSVSRPTAAEMPNMPQSRKLAV